MDKDVKVTLTLESTVLREPGDKTFKLHIAVGDCSVSFQDTDTKEEVGSVKGCLGGGVDIHVGKDYTYSITPLDLFMAVVKAHEARLAHNENGVASQETPVVDSDDKQ